MPAGDKYENLGLSQGIFRHSLRSHLRQLQPVIRKTMEEGFRTLIQSDKKDKDGTLPSVHVNDTIVCAFQLTIELSQDG